MKLHRKIKYYEKVCHAQEFGLVLKVCVTIMGRMSRHLSVIKLTEGNSVKLYKELNHITPITQKNTIKQTSLNFTER